MSDTGAMIETAPVAKILLEKVHLHVHSVIPKDTRLSVDPMIGVDLAAADLAVQLDSFLLGMPSHEHVFYCRWPEDWWQAFRYRFCDWIPRWWLERYPIRWAEKRESVRVFKAVCPHLEAGVNERTCVKWFYEESIR